MWVVQWSAYDSDWEQEAVFGSEDEAWLYIDRVRKEADEITVDIVYRVIKL